ncbi:hypothetical protein [Streptomyces cavernicola]|uniref:Uncharacterized protein n=1 Tax=Streptomyces cavernicola TaxID=3043613 RepID=A0ABT6SBR4_9ACTN|nr:hypothetical protein [Streptomyces sp. B-S-A6]MDI3405399.1 hypothetical protein [Streptomyces sp. B-S-A6]
MDPLAFPVLAGTVLTEAVRFLFDRAAAVLDRRAGRIPLQQPEEVPGQAEPLVVQSGQLTDERMERITQAHGALRVYSSRPEILQGDDAELLDLLGRLRRDLEEVYGRRLPFSDEEAATRPGVEVFQRTEMVDKKQVGVRAHAITEQARVRVVQDTGTIGETGEQVGVEVEGTIG